MPLAATLLLEDEPFYVTSLMTFLREDPLG